MEIKKLILSIVTPILFSSLTFTQQILTIYSDVGISGNNVYTWTDGGTFDSNSTELSTVPEGDKCYKTFCSGTYAGWGVFYNTEQNFSNYQGGELRFWIYSSTGNVKVEVEQWNGTKGTRWLTQYGWNDSYVNQWKLFKISLSEFGINLASIKSPFEITINTQGTFYVDLVRWTTNFVCPDIRIKIKDIETHIEKSSITFNVNRSIISSWTVANEYIEIDVDVDTTTWGIQIYTDNKSADANPKYTGIYNPCGLVDSSNTAIVLPLGWNIIDSTKTKTQLGNGEPGSWSTGGSENGMWKWMRDRNTEGFQNGEYYITLWDNKGILWGAGSGDRSWKNSPNYIYLSADFTDAIGGRNYKTNQLKIELYYR